MPEKRITVWVQRFKDRPTLMLQWIDPDTGKRKSKSAETDDPDKAETARADKEYELNHGLHQEPSKLDWDKFRELFEDEYAAGCRKTTRQNYDDTFNLFERLCSPQKLRSISARTLSLFVAGMRQTPTRGRPGMMPSTVKVRLQFLHTALQWAVDQKMIPECPTFPVVKVPDKKPRPVSEEIFERLFAKAGNEMMRAYLLTGWLAGLRLEEAFILEWEETDKAPYVDFARQQIIFPAELVKGNEDQWVPLDPRLAEVLEKLPGNGRQVFQHVGPDGEPILPGSVSGKISRLAKKAGVKLTYHTLRKGFGCRYAGKVPAQVLQKLMRHANIKTTMDYYANVDDAVMEAVLGPQRNSSRNRGQEMTEDRERVIDVSPCQDGLE
jgi:integrase